MKDLEKKAKYQDYNKFSSFFRNLRFKKALKYLKKGRVLDFGCNDSSLENFLPRGCEYIGCDCDFSVIKGEFDTIFMLAVLEHIPLEDVNNVFKKLCSFLKDDGMLILTTPSKHCHYLLKFLNTIGLSEGNVDKEHKHYWTKEELIQLSKAHGSSLIFYQSFQLGMNQLAIMKKNSEYKKSDVT